MKSQNTYISIKKTCKMLLKSIMFEKMEQIVETCKKINIDNEKLNSVSVAKMADAALNVLYNELKD